MSAITLYVRDRQLWKRARRFAGSQKLSSLVERALRQHLDSQEPQHGDGNRTIVLSVRSDDEGGDMEHNIEFQGQLVTDSEGISVEQLPRIRVYRTAKGRIVVYRTWPSIFELSPRYSVYPDLKSLEADPLALATTWITGEDRLGEHTDLTSDALRELRKVLGRRAGVLAIDELELSDMRHGRSNPVRLPGDAVSIRRALQGSADQDVLLVSMHLQGATEKGPKHLSEIEEAYAGIKPVSRLGNTPDTLKDLQAGMRGYLNNDTRKRSPSLRLFTNPRRGFWGLSRIGERRATEVLHQFGMVRRTEEPRAG